MLVDTIDEDSYQISNMIMSKSTKSDVLKKIDE